MWLTRASSRAPLSCVFAHWLLLVSALLLATAPVAVQSHPSLLAAEYQIRQVEITVHNAYNLEASRQHIPLFEVYTGVVVNAYFDEPLYLDLQPPPEADVVDQLFPSDAPIQPVAVSLYDVANFVKLKADYRQALYGKRSLK